MVDLLKGDEIDMAVCPYFAQFVCVMACKMHIRLKSILIFIYPSNSHLYSQNSDTISPFHFFGFVEKMLSKDSGHWFS